ncbi:cell division protein FtsN [Glaesserella sp.]|uniref:cell division protein FtsN n=1 Tax=Glaesserella sp. TaxID=2094731 RepID=UPI0035A0C72B
MPSRDYAARAKSKKRGGNKTLILAIVILLVLVSGLALWMLTEKAPIQTIPTQTVQPQQPKSTLPTPPEEVYSYIRDLETREVPVDKNSKLAQLTKEQEQQILKQREEEQRKQQELQQAQQQTTQEQVVAQPTEPQQSEQTVKVLTPEEFAAKKAQEQKLAEEKRKQAELKKQQDAKKAEAAKAVTPKPTETAKSGGKYGLQCGAFKNKAQAENMQARLAMAGYNARISSSGEWNRVFVGPIGDRAAASAAQSNARSVAECLIIGM